MTNSRIFEEVTHEIVQAILLHKSMTGPKQTCIHNSYVRSTNVPAAKTEDLFLVLPTWLLPRGAYVR